MIRRVESEIKILGINFFMIMVSFAIALIVLSAIAGELLNFYPVSFEVIFPFFVSMVVGEWGKTRADSNFDIIAAQSKSLFCWVLGRYILIFGVSSVFAFFCMVFSSVFRYELPIWEVFIIYFPPTFFLSSLCTLLGIHCTGEHVATLACGIVWLIVLLMRGLLRISGTEYIYLFIRYAGNQNPVWLWNKCIITAAGLFIWGIVYLKCTLRGFPCFFGSH